MSPSDRTHRDRSHGVPWRSLAVVFTVMVALAVLSVFVSPRVFAQVPPDGGARGGAPGEGTVEPPSALIHPAVVYPPGADGRRVDVELVITVSETGTVTAAEVLGHVPADAAEVFDRVALDAARAMTFHPARRGGVPIPVRLRYHMAISPPVVTLDAGAPSDGGAPPPTELDELGTGAEGVGHVHPHPEATDGGAVADGAVTDGAVTDGAVTDASVTDDGGVTVPTAGPVTVPEPVEGEATVRGHTPPPPRAAGDLYTPIGPGLRQVPRTNASGILNLAAPGILLTNEGGEGHAEQVFLRGFDAHEGQDLEFTVGGVPVNEPGNPHGEGLANTHFVIPELVTAVRVLEGPFDPHQGNYAVAGSVEYELGLDQRGLTMQYSYGSFNTHRLMALWGPEEGEGRRGTFAGVDLHTTDGYGTNRAARYGRAMGQYELALGDSTTLRILAQSYATQYGSAGVLRERDYDSGAVDFFGSYDPTQGGDESRHSVSATLEDRRPGRVVRQQVFAVLRSMRLRENYTGFLLDPPAPWTSSTAQRGDAVDQSSSATTFGGRGSMRLQGDVAGLRQSVEAGYYGRYDTVDSSQRRLRYGTVIPYRTDLDLSQSIANLGLYVDAEVHFTRWLLARGGVRGDYFNYDVLNRCDLHDTSLGAGTAVVDSLCYTRDRTGPRDPTARRSANGLAFEPRATLMAGPWAGITLAASVGMGARAADPAYLGDGNQAPFASILAAEGGVVYNRAWGPTALTLRGLYYYTSVDRDLIFNQQEGRNTLAPGTRRQGALVAWRLTGRWFDVAGSGTYADARFVRVAMDPGATYFPPDAGDKVPYVPTWVLRADGGFHGRLPLPAVQGVGFTGRAGVGITYVSPRTLPYGEQGDAVFLIDASASVRWRWVELGITAQNLLDARYRLGEYNYVSEFRPGTVTPDMVAGRLFTAGPPLSVFGTLTLYLGRTAGDGT